MLLELSVNNFTLVDELRIEFGNGFTVLTGETGAGKSIIVGAIAAVLGERTSVDVIRTGKDKCRVEAVFDIRKLSGIAESLKELGIDTQDNQLILSREISRVGKSVCRANGHVITISALRSLTSSLVDIHGQHDHQSLLAPAAHMDIYDHWIGPDALVLKEGAQQLHAEMIRAEAERDRLSANIRERERQIDLLSFQIRDIDSAELTPGEEEELAVARTRLASAEKLMEHADTVCSALTGETAAMDLLQAALVACEKMATMDPDLEDLAARLGEAVIGVQDAASEIRDYRDSIELDQTALDKVETRLSLISTLKRKYGDSLEDILNFSNSCSVELNRLQHAEELSGELEEKISQLRANLLEVSEQLSGVRFSRKARFELGVETHLSDLAMPGTSFELEITDCEPGAKGKDAIEFLICTNPGEPLKPLVRIASGGEMSRIMLAIKTVCADAGIPVMVFDEIDTGIGGKTGLVLGEKIAALAQSSQVVCVTHLPQVACVADRHLSVRKVVADGHTTIEMDALDSEDRVMELSRMLGTGESSDVAVEHAREMLLNADKGRRKI